MAENANTIWADGPGSMPYQPEKSRIRAWGTDIEEQLASVVETGLTSYATEADFLASDVPGDVPYVTTAGYYTPGDGGGHRKVRVNTPGVAKPWHKQSADGAWWQVAEHEVCPQMFGAKADFDWTTATGNDDTAAIQAAVSYGKKVFVPLGQYRVTDEIEIVTIGQVIEFENTGGYGYGESIGAGWQNNTAFVGTGTFNKRVRTRRNFRGASGDAQDAALSAVLNVQAENVQLIRPCIRLYCDYSNTSSTNLGDDCDVGIFVGCRTGVQIHDPIVTDYFRKVGIYLDVTHATNLPRHLDKAGAPYQNAMNISGGDGTHLFNPYVRGPRVGVGIIGAKPKTGASTYGDPYYDAQLAATVSDFRGTFGFSDFAIFGGRLYGPDHHSNRRLANPTPSGGALNITSLTAEPDFMPAALWIDGMAGNSSGGVWGTSLFGTRVATFEAFRVRLGRASRFRLFGGHIEGRDSGGRMNVAGAVIDTNDYTLNSYGDICGVSGLTGNAMWIGSVRSSPASGALPHFYGANARLDTDDGSIFPGNFIAAASGELDLRAATGGLIRGRVGSSSAVTISLSEMMLVAGRLRMGSLTDDPTLIVGSGTPEGSVIAPVNSLYINKSSSGFATWMYRKNSGTGNTGWVAASN